jgi:hypothetical protein
MMMAAPSSVLTVGISLNSSRPTDADRISSVYLFPRARPCAEEVNFDPPQSGSRALGEPPNGLSYWETALQRSAT